MPYTVTADGGVTTTSFLEGSGGGIRTQSFTVTRSAGELDFPNGQLAVQFNPGGSTAIVNVGGTGDFQTINDGQVFTGGQASVSFTVGIVADTIAEADETLQFGVSINGTQIGTYTFTILNDDAAPVPAGVAPSYDPGARDDAFVIGDNGMVASNVFYNNGNGPDVGGTSRMTVASINGSAAAIGTPVMLPSGAVVMLRADGPFTYNPGSAFTYLPVGSSAVDTFTYALNTGSTATVSITINGVDNADVLRGAGPLAGGLADDLYIVTSSSTVVTERAGEGYDTILTDVSYALAAGSEVEVLSTRTNAASDAINLTGNAFAQVLVGNFGNNVLNGMGGADTLIGLKGDDVYAVGDSRAVVIEAVGEGTDTVVTSVDYALAAGSSVEVLAAQDRGGAFALSLKGNEFGQTLAGNEGANTLDGGLGNDVLIGGGGADRFAFTTALGAGNVDSIADFQPGIDRIALSSTIFAAVGSSVTAAGFTTGAATTADQHILYNPATGQIFYDADGSGSGTAILFAMVSPNLPLSAASFEIIGG